MIIHDVTQGSPEWLALRDNYDTASEASAMMGASKHTSRAELLRMRATGSGKEFSSWFQRHVLDKGHEIEAKARAIVEQEIGEELYPIVGSSEEYTSLMASFDGVTMDETTVWECKQWNESKAEFVRDGIIPPDDFWQVVQQLVVSRASRAIYTLSDGTPEKTISAIYTLNPKDETDLIAGWDQFHKDLYQLKKELAHNGHKPAPQKAIGQAVTLPALTYRMNGLAVISNIDDFRAVAMAAIERSQGPLVTDQDFADREAMCKAFKEAESKLQLIREQVIGEIKDVDLFCRQLDEIRESIRKARLAGEKQVSTRKDEIRAEILFAARKDLDEHIKELNSSLVGVSLPKIADNFAGVMKGKKTVQGLQDAVDTELARLKIEATQLADKIRVNLAILDEVAAGYERLFHDRQELVQKDAEVVRIIATQRVSEAKAEEQRKLEAELERIRQEEAARLAEQERPNTGTAGFDFKDESPAPTLAAVLDRAEPSSTTQSRSVTVHVVLTLDAHASTTNDQIKETILRAIRSAGITAQATNVQVIEN